MEWLKAELRGENCRHGSIQKLQAKISQQVGDIFRMRQRWGLKQQGSNQHITSPMDSRDLSGGSSGGGIQRGIKGVRNGGGGTGMGTKWEEY